MANSLEKLAEKIWKRGEASADNAYCIIPTCYGFGGTELDDKVVEEYGATHFTLKWIDSVLHKVEISLFAAEGYGACLILGKPFLTKIVKIDK